MNIMVTENPQELGREAARLAAEAINKAIAARGGARIALSTGASQFETLDELRKQNVDWTKVDMFHLDEYIGITEEHLASFRKYLKERFTSRVPLKNAYFVDGEGEYEDKMKRLSEELAKAPVDLALIGIGENAHIAFNDPPADFGRKEPYIVVSLDEACKLQQVREGWFPSVSEVPVQAISMSVHQIMESRTIVSAVPHGVKANAVKLALESGVRPEVPASILKTHADWTLVLDRESAAFVKND
ncbi:6-phosphogluconolactonase [Paenibacillus humicola]|uniref:6-phosphogluconolactonase n=1 Tax=Paenibacillus humicola TaxID=3110540 RepID=UPI00237B4E43|nr:6-phosphogluconolactonase [Paenibacillus humicola]